MIKSLRIIYLKTIACVKKANSWLRAAAIAQASIHRFPR
jgi:hypothetical protein